MKKIILNIVSNLLIIFIIILLLNMGYSKLILKDKLINIFGKSFIIVTTGSMEPEINAGELVIISDMKSYEKGDIITYEDEERNLVTHRIVDINENTFIAKGDSNNLNDDEISNFNIKGKVIYHSKILGTFVLYFLKPIVIIYIILFVGINLYFYIIKKNNKKEETKNVEEKIETKEKDINEKN